MTVDELIEALQDISREDKGHYEIVGAADAEGNGYRLLPAWVTVGKFENTGYNNGEFVDEDTLKQETESGGGDAYDNYTQRVVCIG